MRNHFLLLVPALSSIAIAQTSSGISAPVSRTVTLAADEAAFGITVSASLDSTEQQVKQALQSAGLPNPTVVATGLALSPGGGVLLYSATLTIAVGSAGDAAMTAAKSLEALRTHLPAPLQSLQYSVALNPSQAAIEAQRMVVLPQLVDDARKLAQSLAAATGVGVGNIRSISDSGGGAPVGAVYPGNIVPVGMIGAIYDPVLVPQPALPSSTQYTFSLTVVFATVP